MSTEPGAAQIPYSTTEEELYALFAPFGDVRALVIPSDLLTGRSKGFATVEMPPRAGRRAVAELNQSRLGGRQLTVAEWRAMPLGINEDADGAARRLQARLFAHYKQRPDAVRFMDRHGFEELVAEMLKAEGFDVEVTSRSRDGGYDVVAIRNDTLKIRFLVECKRPNPGGRIGVRVVRQLLGVKTADRATKALLVTTGRFTRDARALLEQHQWELEGKDYDALVGWIQKFRPPDTIRLLLE